jgi:hypothetical protein
LYTKFYALRICTTEPVSGNPGVDWKIIIKCDWVGFIWLEIENVGGLL